MISSEAKRTLVKSPPELWAELSDAKALARHLGELGEIRITKVEPEQSVEWEAEDARGRIELKPSGWGTKVALQIERDAPKPAPPLETEIEPEEQAAEARLHAQEQAQEQEHPHEQKRPQEQEAEAATAPPPRPGFFARLFKRRAKPAPASLAAAAAAEPAAAEREPATAAPPAASAAPPAAPAQEPDIPDLATQTDELLDTVLDSLGAAHHRPFSRG